MNSPTVGLGPSNPLRAPASPVDEGPRAAGEPTRWSVIVRAQGCGPDARHALDELIRRYENAVVSLIRGLRHPPGTTPDDLKQEFFTRMLRRGDIRALDRGRGRFRSWLYTAVKHFLGNAWKKWKAEKDGNRVTGPLLADVAGAIDPHHAYMRAFAEDTLAHVLEHHRRTASDSFRFEALQRFLPGPQMDFTDLKSAARALGTAPATLAVAVCRLRARHHVLLREAVASTLDLDPSDPTAASEIGIEMRLLYRYLSEVPAPALRSDE